MKKRLLILTLLVLLTFALTGCATTTISGSWIDPQYRSGKIGKVLVVGLAQGELMRRLYEDAFVARLQEHGIVAVASYSVLPADQETDQDFITRRVQELGFQNVLITRLADRKTIEIVHPGTTYIEGGYYPPPAPYYQRYPYYRHWDDYYYRWHNRYYPTTIQTTPTYVSRQEVVILETNLYAAATGSIIYSVQTETLVDYGAQGKIPEIVGTIVEQLRLNGLI